MKLIVSNVEGVKEYLLHPERRRWLRSHPEMPHRARCIICDRVINAHLRTINDHAMSNRHLRILEELGPDENVYIDEEVFMREVAKVKLTLAAFFARHNLPFQLIDSLLPLIIHISQNVDALREVKMKRTTLTKITKNVLAVSHKTDLFNALCQYKFAIKFDESTDICSEKHGCIIVQIFNDKLNKITSALWDVVPIYKDDEEENDATAETMYRIIINSFNDFQTIPPENLIAYSSDGCSTMIG
ncbi:hypothetical protein TSAR_016272 [Trichomalopsis sarcophagae]|uniref:DUF4371 domain-containing protein n=1 Tax=Trichomalopsis sarcophagae TaxID=543379 RepID=A0A232F5L5_9HYME|nr:hypothetical protein TSAR_016272 [Trichomalopsis sarcophagae]